MDCLSTESNKKRGESPLNSVTIAKLEIIKRLMYQRKVDVVILNAVKSMLADIQAF